MVSAGWGGGARFIGHVVSVHSAQPALLEANWVGRSLSHNTAHHYHFEAYMGD